MKTKQLFNPSQRTCFFLSVVFYWMTPGTAQFHLQSDFYIASNTELHIRAPLTTFDSGSFLTEHGAGGGVVSFAANSGWEGADHNGHIDGNVKVYNPTSFSFPTGQDGVFQPFAIDDATGVNALEVDYRNQAHSSLVPSTGLIKIHPSHYWSIQESSGSARVELSWNTFSQLDAFLGGSVLNDLTIVGYTSGAWELLDSQVEGSATTLSGQIISTDALALSPYSAFALGIKGIAGGGGGAEDMPRVAEGISPNGDGDNDTWIVHGIERFPNAQIYVHNRTGEVVYQALNGYSNDWIGDWNETGETLPSAPYFYTIDLDADGKVDLYGWLYIQN
jgi:gliding motility-associated-like protein